MYLKAPNQNRDIRIFVIGGGFTGVESICSLREYADNLCETFGVSKTRVHFTLLEAAPIILGKTNKKAQVYAEKKMKAMGITVQKDTAVISISTIEIQCTKNRIFPYDLCVWVAGIKPNSVVEDISSLICGKDKTNVDTCMQAHLDKFIFGAGDNVICSGIPRSAYLAIIEGKLAAKNILRTIEGKKCISRQLRTSPLLISLGQKTGMLVYKKFCLKGKFALWIKHLVEWHYVISRKYF